MLYKSTTALMTAGFLFGAAATANPSDEKALMVDQLPEKGSVVMVGTVDTIENNQEFTLRDAKGNTVEIDSEMKLTIREGDRVKVIGMIDDKVLGVGTEIDAASVTVLDAANEKASATGRLHSEAKGEVKKEHINMMVETEEPSDSAKTIKSLPDAGLVTVKGEVSSVNKAENTFTLTDANGDSIDILTVAALTVQVGQEVQVTGQMKAKTEGADETIINANVKVLA